MARTIETRTSKPKIFKPKRFKLKTSCIALAMVFVQALGAQQAPTTVQASAGSAAVGAVPPQPKALPKVFISNVPGEQDPYGPDGPAKAYNSFYAAIRRAGRYELVADPAQADLLFELRYARPWHCVIASSSALDNDQHAVRWTEEFEAFIEVTSRDPRTHASLESHEATVKRAYSQKTANKNFELAIETVAERMGTGMAWIGMDTVQKASPTALPEEPSAGPAPSAFGAATTLFISNSVVDKTRAMDHPQEFYTQVYAAMKSWGRYKLVSSAAEADLVAALTVTEAFGPRCDGSDFTPIKHIELRITVPGTNAVIWGFAQNLSAWRTFFFRKGFTSSEKAVKQTAVLLVEQLRQLTARADAAASPKALGSANRYSITVPRQEK